MLEYLQWSTVQERRRKEKITMLDRIVHYLTEIPSEANKKNVDMT